MVAREQLKMFRPGELELKDPKKLKWEWYGDNHWRSVVKKTREQYICQKCGEPISAGNPASLTIDTDKPKKKLEAEDYKKIQYWHYELNCPEIIEDNPI